MQSSVGSRSRLSAPLILGALPIAALLVSLFVMFFYTAAWQRESPNRNITVAPRFGGAPAEAQTHPHKPAQLWLQLEPWALGVDAAAVLGFGFVLAVARRARG